MGQMLISFGAEESSLRTLAQGSPVLGHCPTVGLPSAESPTVGSGVLSDIGATESMGQV